MSFSYLDSVCDSVYDAITFGEFEIDFSAYASKEDCIDALEDLFIGDDYVTGEASGSFTMSREEAKNNVLADPYTVGDTIRDYDLDTDFLANVFEGDWEKLDILCRQYVLREAIEITMNNLVSNDDDSIKGLTFEWDT